MGFLTGNFCILLRFAKNRLKRKLKISIRQSLIIFPKKRSIYGCISFCGVHGLLFRIIWRLNVVAGVVVVAARFLIWNLILVRDLWSRFGV